ncbi:type II toxin-antitoxin system Phd/YefM family antitoxin [Agrococcus sp. DT81.2]|uniref:type II toxin-antitoxin system Phd/YefM family antitoxin n=1 Tax=Agrococcus sp. DT81.2 TaxID=3393414 RepID=UPI003CE576CC
MATVNMHEAKTHLSALVARAERGEEVVIANAGTPRVRLVPVQPLRRAFGRVAMDVPGDFDDELPDEELAEWE